MTEAPFSGGKGDIRLDKEGGWHFNGLPIINPQIIDLFNNSIERDGDGYRLHIGEETCPIIVDDAPYVVTRLALEREPGGREFFSIHLNDGSREELALDSLYIGRENVPYCAVKQGRFPARFLRAPYYSLAQHIEQAEDARFFIPVNGAKHYLKIL